MSEVISVANILSLKAKHGLKFAPGAISSDSQKGLACARGVLAIEAFGGIENLISSYRLGRRGIYSPEVPKHFGIPMREIDALELGFLSDDNEPNTHFNATAGERAAFDVGYQLRDYITPA